MNRIQNLFAASRKSGKKIFAAYLTMGFPDMDFSRRAVETMIRNGVDIIEFGVPFSDPMADGPVIRLAGRKALEHGCTLEKVLECIASLRKEFPETPFVLFSYYNVLFSRGLEKFAAEAEAAGVDAVLAVDVVLEDRDELLTVLRAHNMTLVPLVAPTTSLERAAKIAEGLEDSFLYAVTVKGVTGARAELPPELEQHLKEVKNVTGMPVLAGFGVSTPQQAERINRSADGFIIGSTIVKLLLDHPDETGLQQLAEFARGF